MLQQVTGYATVVSWSKPESSIALSPAKIVYDITTEPSFQIGVRAAALNFCFQLGLRISRSRRVAEGVC
jgi:hypothetical protein